MFTCPKCGQKLKTLHERVYGERPHYVPSGYHCETCRIYYDAGTKLKSKAVYGATRTSTNNEVREPELLAGPEDTRRMRSLQTTNAIAAQNECENESAEIMQLGIANMREYGPRGTRTLDQLLRRQPFCPS